MNRKIIIASIYSIGALLPSIVLAQEAPSFGGIFTDNIVIQRGKPVAFWGKAGANNQVSLKFANNEYKTNADNDGRWRISIPPMQANSVSQSVIISSNGKVSRLENILIGDVFLCSGQSNMEFTAKYETNAEQNINRGADPLLRFYNVPKQTADTEQMDFIKPSKWQIAQTNTIGDTSALCFSMAQEFRKKHDIPVGFINSSWGGTKIETWISEAILKKRPRYHQQIEHSNALKRDPTGASTAWAKANLAYWETNEPAIASKKQWRLANFNDNDWKDIQVGTFWEEAGQKELEIFDGLVWYRTKFNLTGTQAKSEAIINLGPIDDADNLFINGVFTGATEGWDTKRQYKIPSGILKDGENTIAIRIYDGGGGGGLWGGPNENFISFVNAPSVRLSGTWKYKISAGVSQTGNPPSSATSPATRPSTIYNAMIAPLRGLSIAGVAWYQGESNVGLANEYEDASALWMENWRSDFNNPNLPFGIVQLSAFGKSVTTPVNSAWAKLRYMQLKVVEKDKNSAIAVSLDIGDKYDVHPTQKQILGLRLAKSLGALVYQNGYSRTGPIATRARETNNKILVEFANLGGGLLSYSAKYPPGVELCDTDKCEFALAQIQNNNLVVDIPLRMRPVKLRYAWSDSPVVSLFSKDDLPIPTFEIDIEK